MSRKSKRNKTAETDKTSDDNSHKISERTGCLLSDMLNLFEKGKMHDCTFRVGSVSGPKTVCIKCGIFLSRFDNNCGHILGLQMPQADSLGGQRCVPGHALWQFQGG